jgi:CheY-like chemotaxis protein
MSKRILLVDDEPSSRYSAAKALVAAGYEVVAAADYIGALNEIGTASKVDLLLTDVVMPNGMNGFALGRMARMRQRDLKIIYMTAYDVPKDEAIGPILRKPTEASLLVAEVEAVLAGPADQAQPNSSTATGE